MIGVESGLSTQHTCARILHNTTRKWYSLMRTWTGRSYGGEFVLVVDNIIKIGPIVPDYDFDEKTDKSTDEIVGYLFTIRMASDYGEFFHYKAKKDAEAARASLIKAIEEA